MKERTLEEIQQSIRNIQNAKEYYRCLRTNLLTQKKQMKSSKIEQSQIKRLILEVRKNEERSN